MRKFEEISRPDGCLGKALDSEMLFVLLSRDPAAPNAIRAWCEERVKMGLNRPDDPQITEALRCASTMTAEISEVKAAVRAQREQEVRDGR